MRRAVVVERTTLRVVPEQPRPPARGARGRAGAVSVHGRRLRRRDRRRRAQRADRRRLPGAGGRPGRGAREALRARRHARHRRLLDALPVQPRPVRRCRSGPSCRPTRDLGLDAQGVRFAEPAQPFSARTEPGAAGAGGRAGRPRAWRGEIEAMLTAASQRGRAAALPPARRGGQERARLPAGTRDAVLALADATPRSLAERADDPRAAVVLRYACGLAGFLDGDVPLGLIGAFCRGPAVQPGARGRAARRTSPTRSLGSPRPAGARGCGQLRGHAASNGPATASGSAPPTLASCERAPWSRRSTSAPPSSACLGGELATAELRETAARWIVEPTGPFTAHYGIKGEPRPLGDGARTRDASASPMPRRWSAHFADAAEGRAAGRPSAGHLTCGEPSTTRSRPHPGPYGPLHTLRLQTLRALRARRTAAGTASARPTGGSAGTRSSPTSPTSARPGCCSSSATRRSTSSGASPPRAAARFARARWSRSRP